MRANLAIIILLALGPILALSFMAAKHYQPKTTTPKPTPPGTLHVYLATQTGLTYICQTKQTVSQVITCTSGETVLLTEQLHKQIVLTTAKLP